MNIAGGEAVFGRDEIRQQLRKLGSPTVSALFAARCALRVSPIYIRQASGTKHGISAVVAAIFSGLLAWRSASTTFYDFGDATRAAASDIPSYVDAAEPGAVTDAAASAGAAALAAAAIFTGPVAASEAHDPGAEAAEASANSADMAVRAAAAFHSISSTDAAASAPLLIQVNSDLVFANKEGVGIFAYRPLWPEAKPTFWTEIWSEAVSMLGATDPSLPNLFSGIVDGQPDFDAIERWFLAWYENRRSGIALAGTSSADVVSIPEVEQEGVAQAPPILHARSTLTAARVEALAERDCLGRQHITEALRLLIAEREGTQHFALGLFGYWGSGKSSLIRHLSEELKQRNPEILVAEFNAWKNERASNLGAMLAQSVVERLTEDMGFIAKLRLAVKLSARRNASVPRSLAKDGSRLKSKLQENSPWLLLATPPLLLAAAVILLLANIPLPNSDLFKWLFGSIAVIAATLRTAISFLRHNLTEWFKRVDAHKALTHLKLPDYSEHRGLLVEIHRTLGELCAMCLDGTDNSDGKALLLVVDDLDRCAIGTVKEVFDAVRLVADIPRVITLVAIDERMAFAAVEKHYDQFGHAGRPPAHVAREYLAKVLQTSVRLPEATDADIQRYVEEQLFSGIAEKGALRPGLAESPRTSEVAGGEVSEAGSGGTSVSASAPPADKRAETEEGLAPQAAEKRVDAVHLAVSSQLALPEEVTLFRKLAISYDFRNPRLIGRLHLSWRLLKALLFGERAYAFSEVESSMRLLFWREYRLQQDASRRTHLDDWLARGCTLPGPQELIGALDGLSDEMIGTFMGHSWQKRLDLVDAVLLPASPPILTNEVTEATAGATAN